MSAYVSIHQECQQPPFARSVAVAKRLIMFSCRPGT
jgi:hypothetical protein